MTIPDTNRDAVVDSPGRARIIGPEVVIMHQSLRRLTVLALTALAVLFSAGCPSRQSIIPHEPTAVVPHEATAVVAEDGSGDYASVSEAVGAASPGDFIYVKSGIYEGEVEIEDLDGLTLMGADPATTIIDADDGYAAVTLNSDDVSLKGFTLRNGSSHGVYVKNGHHKVSHCLITDNGDRGVYFSSFSGEPSAVIDHCTIADNEVSAIYAPTDHVKTKVTNCIIAFNDRGIVSDEDEGNMTIDYNCVYEDGDEFVRVTEGENNIVEDPEFVDRDSGDYRLSNDSPCLGQAEGGGNIGCF